MAIAVDKEMLFLAVEGTSCGFWLKVRHEDTVSWDQWLLGLSHMLPLRNIVSLCAELHEPLLPVVLGEMVNLEELSIWLRHRDTDWRDWRPGNVAKSLRLGVVEIVSLLGRRAQWGHPIRRLVVQAISVQFGDLPPPHFAEELAELKDFVEEYEECIDPDTHVCPFEMQEMWNVESA